MANNKFSADIKDDILFRCGEPTDGTSDFDDAALRYLNRAYRAIWMGGGTLDPTLNEDWWWLRKDPPGSLVLATAITSGTVSVTEDNTSITFSSGPTPSVAGWFFKVSGDTDVFRISAHTATQTGATLATAYTGSTDGSASYTLYKLEYALASDVIRLIAPMRSFNNPSRVKLDHDFTIVGTEIAALDRKNPIASTAAGEPDQFAMIGNQTVRFNRYPSSKRVVEYDYLYAPADLTDSGSEEPVIPIEWRHVLSDVGTFLMMLDKNDNRATATGELARNGLRAMAVENKHRMDVIKRKAGIIYTRPSVALNPPTPAQEVAAG